MESISHPSKSPRQVFTLGYGGRKPLEFVALLQSAHVRTVVDVRLQPNRASMGAYVKAKSPDKGIERLLRDASIGYVSIPELGNPFKDAPDWPTQYAALMAREGQTLLTHLDGIPEPFCLLCAEKSVCHCHRQHIADLLAAGGDQIIHL